MRTTALLLLGLLLVAPAAGASQFEAFDRGAQARASDLIVIGRVAEVRPGRDDRGIGIVTEAEVDVEEVWKGLPSNERIVVRTPGGAIDDVELVVEGAARFRPGEAVVLFLEREGEHWRPWGMAFGKYAIERSRGDVFLVGSLPPAVSGAQRFERVSIGLDELRREVAAALEGDDR